MVFWYCMLNKIVVVSGMVNLISLWYSLIYRDCFNIHMVSKEIMLYLNRMIEFCKIGCVLPGG